MIEDAVRVARATAADKSVIERLLQPYLRELSTWLGIGARDTLAYPYLHLYWQEPDRQPFLLRVQDRAVGFALVNTWSPSARPVDHAMAEFYVVPDFRRSGIGATAGAEIIGGLPGCWEIGMSASNDSARLFWAHVVQKIPGAEAQWLEGDGERWSGPILRFQAAGRRG